MNIEQRLRILEKKVGIKENKSITLKDLLFLIQDIPSNCEGYRIKYNKPSGKWGFFSSGDFETKDELKKDVIANFGRFPQEVEEIWAIKRYRSRSWEDPYDKGEATIYHLDGTTEQISGVYD